MATSLQHNIIQMPQTSLNTGGSTSNILGIPNSNDELTSIFRPMRVTSEEITSTLEAVLSELIDDLSLGVSFDVHRALKKGYFLLPDTDDEALKQFEIIDRPGFDVFGQLPPSRGRSNGAASSNTSGNMNQQYECPCPNCGRTMAVSRFAPHLEKCMIGLGRTSGRLASRRLADLGAILFADRSTSSASSDTASSASRSSLGEDDFEWTVNGPKGSVPSSKGVKRSKTQRKQFTAPTPSGGSQTSDSNGSQSTPVSIVSRFSGTLSSSVTPTGGTTPRRQSSTPGSKRSRQSVKSKQLDVPKYSHIDSTASTPVPSKPPTLNSGSTPTSSRSVGNVFESLAAQMLESSSSDPSNGSGRAARGRVG